MLNEAEVIEKFKRKIERSFFAFGLFLGNVEILSNYKHSNHEMDILAKGEMRFYNGLPQLNGWNVEIESRDINLKTIHKKSNGFLLSFITPFNENAKVHANGEVYSTIVYDSGFRGYSIHSNNRWIKEASKGIDTSALDLIIKSGMNAEFKRSVLFSLGDMISEGGIKKISFADNPYIIVKLYYGEDSENIILDVPQNEPIIRDLELLLTLDNKEFHKGTNSIMTNRKREFKSKRLSRTIYVSGTKKEVRPGSSIKEIKYTA